MKKREIRTFGPSEVVLTPEEYVYNLPLNQPIAVHVISEKNLIPELTFREKFYVHELDEEKDDSECELKNRVEELEPAMHEFVDNYQKSGKGIKHTI